MFTNDIALHYGGKERFTDRQHVITARLFIVGIVLVTYLLSLGDSPRVFQVGVWCFSGFSALFPLVVAALYWKRLSLTGAYAGVLAAAACWLYLFAQSDFGRTPNYAVEIPWPGGPVSVMPVAAITLCSTLAILGISWITPPPSQATLQKFFKS